VYHQRYGPVWEARLRERWYDTAWSLERIATESGAAPKQVQAHAARLGLPFSAALGRAPLPGNAHRPRIKLSLGERREGYRVQRRALRQVEEDGEALRRAESSRLQMALRCRETEAAIRAQQRQERDAEMSAHIEVAAEHLRAASTAGRRVTRTALFAAAGYRAQNDARLVERGMTQTLDAVRRALAALNGGEGEREMLE